jgi:hypothetical protein
MLQTKFGDHPSISSVEADVLRYSCFKQSLKGANPIYMSTLDKHYQRMLQTKFGDHPPISAVEADI